MNNSNADEIVECPLCMEPLEVDDLNFFPCTCGYQICRFCWHRIRTDENELCPACRKEYPENPADFKPLSQEEMIAFKFQKRQRDQQRKQKITENRKHLANVRVVQKNLVFVVGLPPRLADAEILRKHEYFGKYGKIHKVVINPSTTYAGIQGPSASAYVTYIQNPDALRAIQSVNNIMIDGRLIKTSLGTTKYCSHFMKNQQCPKPDCMYLHELGDPEASFTKEEMHQGKHQDYEKRLHELLVATSYSSAPGVSISNVVGASVSNSNCSKVSGMNPTSSINASTSSTDSANNIQPLTISVQQKEAWPCLSLSPVNQKETVSIVVNKSKKERSKPDKSKNEKNSKTKNKNSANSTSMASLSKEVGSFASSSINIEKGIPYSPDNIMEKSGMDKLKEKAHNVAERLKTKHNKEEIKDVDTKEVPVGENLDYDNNNIVPIPFEKSIFENSFLCNSESKIRGAVAKSLTSTSDLQSDDRSYNILKFDVNEEQSCEPTTSFIDSIEIGDSPINCPLPMYKSIIKSSMDILKPTFSLKPTDEMDVITVPTIPDSNVSDEVPNPGIVTASLTLGNDTFQQTVASNNKNVDAAFRDQLGVRNIPNLPDLINGIDVYQTNISSSNDWEDAFKNVMLKTTRQMDDKLQQQHLHQQIEKNNQLKHLEDLRRLQELQKRHVFLNSINASQMSFARNGAELNRQPHYMEQQNKLLQQQAIHKANQNVMQTPTFETNMSKFFDFHKHQQQKMQQQNVHNGVSVIGGGHSENYHMMSVLENKLINTHLMEHNTQPTHLQNPKNCGKLDQMICYHQLAQTQNKQSIQHNQLKNPYVQHPSADDDLGFDPFIETQKALAELIENEEEQQNANMSAHAKHSALNQYNHQHTNQEQISDPAQTFRLPQAGCNYVNNLSAYNVSPKMQANSKILPFVNISNNNNDSGNLPIQQHQLASNVWSTHMGNIQQYPGVSENRREQFGQNGDNQKGCTGSDWTAMDPAILSFRQFSFPQQNLMGSQMQQPQPEMFLQQIPHQPHQTVFGQQSQHGGNSSMSNAAINSHHGSQAQVAANVQGMLEYLKNRQCI